MYKCVVTPTQYFYNSLHAWLEMHIQKVGIIDQNELKIIKKLTV